MPFSSQLLLDLEKLAAVVVAMGAIAVLELAIPLHARSRAQREHLAPNLVLTLIALLTNTLFNSALVLALAAVHARGVSLMRVLDLPPLLDVLVVVLVLDLSFYVAHVLMHYVPAFWRVHRVHHSDRALDVTTTIRQHPIEGLIRFAFMAVPALAIGASPVAFGVYRLWSALNGLFEHANLDLGARIDGALARVVTTPNMHKVHHSRQPHETNTNFGNIFSIFDRALSTYTSAERGRSVVCGLDGFDAPEQQSASGLLALPFEKRGAPCLERP